MFVRRGSNFLVLHRSEPQGSYWHTVSGALEDGETYADAAARELLEETGLETAPVDLELHFAYEPEPWEPHFALVGPVVSVECFLAEAPAGWEPTLDWEHDQHRWCTRDEAVGLLYWPSVRDALAVVP